MRVLLINPPYPVCESLTMPLGLLYLASRLERDGHRVALEDIQLCRAPLARMKPTLHRWQPHVAGITSFSLNLSKASKILRSIKCLFPEVLTVWGGPHVSFDDEGILRKHPWVDVVVRGEGEETLSELVGRVEKGKGFEEVPGITWRDAAGQWMRNPDRPFRRSLDDLPRPAWHLLDLAKYRAFGDGASIMTSRGCPHRCTFCVGRRMIGAKGRFRNPSAVVDEMEALAGLGFRKIRVEDDLFTFRRDRALAICQEIDRRGLNIQWRAYARVDTVDPELLRWMRRAGCERILFGAESGSPEILQKVRKGITPDQTRRAVEITREAGIRVLASFVLGLPGETPETLRQTLEFAESLAVPYSLNLLTPYLGTELRERASEWGVEILSNDWNLYGQSKALTATAEVKPWHLSRAVGKYWKRLGGYLDDLLAGERRGMLEGAQAEEIRKHHHWSFLRKMISEELLESCGRVAGSDGQSLDHLAGSLTRPTGLALGEVKKHLAPLLQNGCILFKKQPKDGSRWVWAPS